MLGYDHCRYDKVGFLDCDVGQSEFSPSGVVSLTTVSSPLTGMDMFVAIFMSVIVLGPPCTHQQAPDKFVWVR